MYLFWIKDKFTLTNKRIIFHRTDYILNILGFVKVGTTDLSIPLRKFSDIYTNPRVLPLLIPIHIIGIPVCLFMLSLPGLFINMGTYGFTLSNGGIGALLIGLFFIIIGLLLAAPFLFLLFICVFSLFQYRFVEFSIEDEYGRKWVKRVYVYSDNNKIESFTSAIYSLLK